MKVRELIEMLQEVENKELYVLTTDNEHWFYDLDGGFEEVKIKDGRIDEENGELVLVIY